MLGGKLGAERVDLEVRAADRSCSHAFSMDCTLGHSFGFRRQRARAMIFGCGTRYVFLQFVLTVQGSGRGRGRGRGRGNGE